MNIESIYKKVENIPGWFSYEDAQIYGKILTNSSNVVEVGSFLGKSAVFASYFGPVTCIDPWRCGPKMKEKICSYGFSFENDDFHHVFKHYAIDNNENGNRITTIQKNDQLVYPTWAQGKIDVMFLDHDHTYQSVINSLFGWKTHMKKYGKILIHDSNWDCVKKAIEDSGINQYQIKASSLFQPMLCSWGSV